MVAVYLAQSSSVSGWASLTLLLIVAVLIVPPVTKLTKWAMGLITGTAAMMYWRSDLPGWFLEMFW